MKFEAVEQALIGSANDNVPAVGDVNSNERGSGARYNNGKVPYDMLPLQLITDHLAQFRDSDHPADEIIAHMGRWQAGDGTALDDALMATMDTPNLECLANAAHVFQHVTTRPVKPYPKWNWMKGMAWSVPLGCVIRHALAWRRGEEFDPETKLPHVGHIQCNLLMLKLYTKVYPEGDDRPKEWLRR